MVLPPNAIILPLDENIGKVIRSINLGYSPFSDSTPNVIKSFLFRFAFLKNLYCS